MAGPAGTNIDDPNIVHGQPVAKDALDAPGTPVALQKTVSLPVRLARHTVKQAQRYLSSSASESTEQLENAIRGWRIFYGGWTGLVALAAVIGAFAMWLDWVSQLAMAERAFTGGKPIWLGPVTQYQAITYGLSLASRAGVLICIVTVGFGVARYITLVLIPSQKAAALDEAQWIASVLAQNAKLPETPAGPEN